MKQVGIDRQAFLPAITGAVVAPAVLLCLLSAQPAKAQTASGETNVDIRKPLTVVKNSDLDFGTFVAGTTNSEFRIDAVTGIMAQLNGNALAMGGTTSRASFTATGTPFQQANIRRSQNSIDIVRDGGSETMRVNDFFTGCQSQSRSAFSGFIGTILG